jgi:hypothetical protein
MDVILRPAKFCSMLKTRAINFGNFLCLMISKGHCRCLNHSTSMGGTHSKVEGGDRHDLEPKGMREDTRNKIYTGSGSRSSYPTSCLG